MIDDNLLVSILVPIFNVEKYIGKCAESLFLQTYRNIEYVFVDDCCQDRSIEVLEGVIRNHGFPQIDTLLSVILKTKESLFLVRIVLPMQEESMYYSLTVMIG